MFKKYVLAFLLLCFTGSSQASLIGDRVRIGGDLFLNPLWVTVMEGGGPEATSTTGLSIDIEASSITISYTGAAAGLFLDPVMPQFFDLNWIGKDGKVIEGKITDVGVSTMNVTGNTNVIFSDDFIGFDRATGQQKLTTTFQPGGKITLNIKAKHIPEPPMVWLVSFALLICALRISERKPTQSRLTA